MWLPSARACSVRKVRTIGGLLLAASLVVTGVSPADAAALSNCQAVNAKFPGGVARSKSAWNWKTVGGKHVRARSNFSPRVSATLYKQLKRLDRDGDGIACEK